MAEDSTLGDQFRASLALSQMKANKAAIQTFTASLQAQVTGLMQSNDAVIQNGAEPQKFLALKMPYPVTEKEIVAMSEYKTVYDFCKKENLFLDETWLGLQSIRIKMDKPFEEVSRKYRPTFSGKPDGTEACPYKPLP